METNSSHKTRSTLDTPVVLFDCKLSNGQVERWATHEVGWLGNLYTARILKHSAFSLSSWSLEGSAGASRLQITLANTDSYASQIELTTGFKGAKLTAWFCFHDVASGEATTEPEAVFLGVANPPDEYDESILRLSFQSRLNMERMALPTARIQPRCPWAFPSSQRQREEALSGGSRGKYSPFFACGYSADVPGGVGNLNGGEAFTSCGKTKLDCQERGMFGTDSRSQTTQRFGGCQFLPPSVTVRSHGDKTLKQSAGQPGPARPGDVLPLVYGTSWLQPPIIFSRSDGNYVHFEAVLGSGPIQGVRRVLADGVDVPEGQPGGNYSSTGWWSLVGVGERSGTFNPAFADGSGQPIGDPHGSTAFLAVALPSKSVGQSTPRIQALVDGIKLERFDAAGDSLGLGFTRNPAWMLLDLLRRCGWALAEINLASFARAAAACDEVIEVADSMGVVRQVASFEAGLALDRMKSASELVRGLQAASNTYLGIGSDGRLALSAEGSLAEQQGTLSSTSNATSLLNGGWPSFEFGDGSSGTTGLLDAGRGEAALRFWTRPTSMSPNRYEVEYQDAFEDYRQNALSLLDVDDVENLGQEISASHPALGTLNYAQAGRVLRLALDKSLRGNLYAEFDSSIQSFGVRPGDIVTLTHAKHGLDRATFRVQAVEPGINYQTVRFRAQVHNDSWYDEAQDTPGQSRSQEGWTTQIPRPLAGKTFSAAGEEQFDLYEKTYLLEDGKAAVELHAGFTPPVNASQSGLTPPRVGSEPEIHLTGGTLSTGSLNYAITGVDEAGVESAPSLVVGVAIPAGQSTASVTLLQIGFTTETRKLRVYRGDDSLRLRLIAEVDPASTFTDPGLPAQLIPIPDPSYFEARFYWRFEIQPPFNADAVSGRTLYVAGLNAGENAFATHAVRILDGRGRGQEALVRTNSQDTIELVTPFDPAPDPSSTLAVVEASWRTGGTTRGEEAAFEVWNRAGATIHVMGVAVNRTGVESPYASSTITRHQITGDSPAGLDYDVPPEPTFGLSPAAGGYLELSNLGVPTIENVNSVFAGTLVVHYVDELQPADGCQLAAGCDESTVLLEFTHALPVVPGAFVLVGREIVQIIETVGPATYEVSRGELGSQAEAQSTGTPVTSLGVVSSSLSFGAGFFGSPASATYQARIPFEAKLLVAAEFALTNSHGSSPPGRACYTGMPGGGLVTELGRRFVIQQSGLLALQSSIAPPLGVDADYVVREVEALVSEAAVGGSIEAVVQADRQEWLRMVIHDGATRATIRQQGLILTAGSVVTVDVQGVPQGAATWPGRDLTISIRV